ncbi:MAG: hypothetical protein QF605_11525 [Rhodospirillales bacterium]|nr:hypothetical protein [Rhodospirillales bacterium]
MESRLTERLGAGLIPTNLTIADKILYKLSKNNELNVLINVRKEEK